MRGVPLRGVGQRSRVRSTALSGPRIGTGTRIVTWTRSLPQGLHGLFADGDHVVVDGFPEPQPRVLPFGDPEHGLMMWFDDQGCPAPTHRPRC